MAEQVRRGGLKPLWPTKGRVGSNPTPGTASQRQTRRSRAYGVLMKYTEVQPLVTIWSQPERLGGACDTVCETLVQSR